MSGFVIKKATKKAKKLRIGMSAGSGFGKTYSALLLGFGICGDWEKICVIDTERDSASLYADLGPYNTLQLLAPYSPERYIEAIKACEDAGMEVIIIDSITHEWEGEGGCLEIHDKLGGRYQDWGKVTPRHRDFIDAILNSRCHVITTVRRKQDYEMSNINGRVVVQKVGSKEITREGFEYELDINFEIVNENHLTKASKDRTSLFANKAEFIITVDTGKTIAQWASGGESLLDEALRDVRNAKSIDKLTSIYNMYKDQLGTNKDLVDAIKARRQELQDLAGQPAAKQAPVVSPAQTVQVQPTALVTPPSTEEDF